MAEGSRLEDVLARARSEERPRDECGVVGVHGHPEASTIAYLGLYALQHRGQELSLIHI